MKILFIGGIFKDQSEYIKYSEGVNQTSADNFQKMILKIIKINHHVKIISLPFVSTYPKYYKKFFTKHKKYFYKNIKVEQLFTLNIKGIYLISRLLSLSIRLLRMRQYKVLVVYSANSPFLISSFIHKILFKSKIILILPDLPEYMNLNNKMSAIKKMLKSLDIKVISFLYQYIDGFIFLTKYMNEKVNVNKKPYIVLESVIDNVLLQKENKKDIILYSGTLNYKYGIKEFIEDFISSEDINLTLVICGSGEAENYIKKMEKEHKNIVFLGNITKERLVKLQKEAKLLVNPRKNNEEYTKYSFPSKITEYLESGTPVVCYKLDGIGEEYKEVLHYIDEKSISEIINKTILIDDKSEELYNKKLNNFIKKYKNIVIQTQKIDNLIEKVEGENNY